MTLTLKRIGRNDHATFGVLLNGTAPFAVTLEPPWKNNEPNVSCIPSGTYACRRVDSPRFGDTFEITGVPGRDYILFHGGNTSKDTLGCVLIGESFDPVNGVDGIANSRQGFIQLKALLAGQDQFTLTILDLT